jgi:hypothetical protein
MGVRERARRPALILRTLVRVFSQSAPWPQLTPPKVDTASLDGPNRSGRSRILRTLLVSAYSAWFARRHALTPREVSSEYTERRYEPRREWPTN